MIDAATVQFMLDVEQIRQSVINGGIHSLFEAPESLKAGNPLAYFGVIYDSDKMVGHGFILSKYFMTYEEAEKQDASLEDDEQDMKTDRDTSYKCYDVTHYDAYHTINWCETKKDGNGWIEKDGYKFKLYVLVIQRKEKDKTKTYKCVEIRLPDDPMVIQIFENGEIVYRSTEGNISEYPH